MPVVFILLIFVFSLAYYFFAQIFVAQRRKRIQKAPFPKEWEAFLAENISVYRYLPVRHKRQLMKSIQVFVAEKNFEGCAGLELTDEIKVTIAAQACLLVVNKGNYFYPSLTTILVYPMPFVSKKTKKVERTRIPVRAGESWQTGVVILAWDQVRKGIRDPSDGYNVALHEFSHQLDQEDGRADGFPLLEKGTHYASWAQVFNQEYRKLHKDIEKNSRHLLREYAALNPAEFFAVVTEAFFERPKKLSKKHPKLYQQLKKYYRLDPAQWNK